MAQDSTHSTHNYFAHGGSELVIGGKLTILPDASIEDEAGILGSGAGASFSQLPSIQNSEATTVAALREDFNSLLDSLRQAGFINADK